MNIPNRIVSTLLFLVLLLGIIITAINPLAVLEGLRGSLSWTMDSLRQMEAQSRLFYILWRIAAVLLSALVFGGLVWLEVRRPGVRTVSLQTQSGQTALLTTDSVSRRLAWHIDQLPGVVTAIPAIFGRGGVVNITMDLETSPDVDVPTKTEEILNTTRSVIEQKMGLKLGKVQVRIRHAPYPETRSTAGSQ